jgi:SAM-dependent methyltransferase
LLLLHGATETLQGLEMARKKMDTRSIGLDVGLAFSKFLTGKENLHYGLWDPKWDVCAANVGRAQEAYTSKLFALLPKEKGLNILDIGGGAGETAKKLVALGHHVEIVIPSPYLAERCRQNAGPTAIVHECVFEDFETDKKFDVCLFSESFQYIPMDISLTKSASLLAPGGTIIVSDCFRTKAFFATKTEYSKVGGGHGLDDFHTVLLTLPLEIQHDEDITELVAPTVDVEQEMFNVFGYAVARTDAGLTFSHPWVRGVLAGMTKLFLSKRRRDRLSSRLFEKERSAKAFCQYNRYVMVKLKPVD